MINNMIMKMRGDKCHPGRGKRVKIRLLPNNVGKKSANDAGPKQGHNNPPFLPINSSAGVGQRLQRHKLKLSKNFQELFKVVK